MSQISTLIFKSHTIKFNEVNLSPSAGDAFETNVMKFAGEWLKSDNKIFEIQTSGSTGIPKKIILTREQIKASVRLTKKYFQLSQGQVALLCLDPALIAGKMMIVRAIEIGMDLVCIPPTANPLSGLENTPAISLAAIVPYQLEEILNTPESMTKLGKVDKIIVGGSQVSYSTIEKLQLLPTKFYETYGMTETITHVAVRKLNPIEKYFTALPGVSFSVDNRNCLIVHAQHLQTQPIITNDIAELINPLQFRLIGRADNIINTGSFKVLPEAIETKIGSLLFPFIGDKSFFIAGVEDQTFGQKVVLYIESNPISEMDKVKILTDLKIHLQKWETPKDIISVPVFKRTKSGKIDRVETRKTAIYPSL